MDYSPPFFSSLCSNLLLHDACALLRSKARGICAELLHQAQEPAIHPPVLTGFLSSSRSSSSTPSCARIPLELTRRWTSKAAQLYRKRVALIARHSDSPNSRWRRPRSNWLARAASKPSGDPRMQRRRMHVGYYLIDKGFPASPPAWASIHPGLARARMGSRQRRRFLHRRRSRSSPSSFLRSRSSRSCLDSTASLRLVFAFLLLLPPAMQIAVDLVNHCVTPSLIPSRFPSWISARGSLTSAPPGCRALAAAERNTGA